MITYWMIVGIWVVVTLILLYMFIDEPNSVKETSSRSYKHYSKGVSSNYEGGNDLPVFILLGM